ncbi:MAG: ATP-dependent zinc protease [Chromatiaceae bacterium]|nr:MAG: ATP-dependent zinc protease [Chromatiaceae bacterium]
MAQSAALTPAHWLAALAVLLLPACASDLLQVAPEDLADLRIRIEQQGDQLDQLARDQAAAVGALTAAQRTADADLLSGIEVRLAAQECPPPAPIMVMAPAPTPAALPPPVAAETGREARRDQLIVGARERIYLPATGHVYIARIDSGATTSSLDVRNIERFERDGKRWVRFDVPAPDDQNNLTTLERRVVRVVRIFQSAAEEGERRLVVQLQFVLGDIRRKADFTLSDRGHLGNPVLIGRNILQDEILIDVGREFMTALPTDLPAAGADDSR